MSEAKRDLRESQDACPTAGRRDFFRKLGAGIAAAILGLVPAGAGLAVFLDPLRRRAEAGGAVRVTTLEALPDDGVPRRFPVVATRVDAWNKFPQTQVGAVYLRRTRDGQIQAFNAICPHAGCFVEFAAEPGRFVCPCHNSRFSMSGQMDGQSSPAPRGLDALPVELRGSNEVWVKFQKFQTGRTQKIAA